MATRTTDGRAVRMLSIMDEWTRECVSIDVARNFKAYDVVDRLTDLFMSGTIHDEDQPCHLKIHDRDKCIECIDLYDAPCQRFCPASVYEMVDDAANPGKQKLQLNFSNCVHCKTCDIKDPYGIIDWVPPEGEGGPKYTWT